MKKLIYFVALVIIILSSCKGNENKQAGSNPDSTSAPAVNTSVATPVVQDSIAKPGQYTCPMHPEVISDKPGSCPKCGMDLQMKS